MEWKKEEIFYKGINKILYRIFFPLSTGIKSIKIDQEKPDELHV